jgi:hypothetical protein
MHLFDLPANRPDSVCSRVCAATRSLREPTRFGVRSPGVEPPAFWKRTLGRRRLVWRAKEVPLTSDVLDPEREPEEREPEPEQPETVPEEEPGITAPEPDTLPEEPDITPPDSAGPRIWTTVARSRSVRTRGPETPIDSSQTTLVGAETSFSAPTRSRPRSVDLQAGRQSWPWGA